MRKKYYGVAKISKGHEYRWIFDEKTLSVNLYEGGEVPDNDCIDRPYPFGGSDCTATFIERLRGNKAIKNFLTKEALGPDVEDPELVDIGEYYLTIDKDFDSCTDTFMKKFGLDYEELRQEDTRADEILLMSKALKKKKYDSFDYENPFYGENRNMTFWELCELYEKVTGRKPMILS